jgi:hypothetical protein
MDLLTGQHMGRTTTRVITGQPQSARMATMTTTRMHVLLTATMGLAGSPAASLSAQVPGSAAGIMAVVASMADVDLWAGAASQVVDADLMVEAEALPGAAQ